MEEIFYYHEDRTSINICIFRLSYDSMSSFSSDEGLHSLRYLDLIRIAQMKRSDKHKQIFRVEVGLVILD